MSDGVQPGAGSAPAVDRLLPEGWEFDNHLAILAGGDCGPLAHELARRGQQRLIVHLPAGAADGDLPGVARPSRAMHDVMHAVLNFPGQVPRNALLHRVADPGVTSELLGELADTLRRSIEARVMNQRTIDSFGEIWTRQGIANLPQVARRPSTAALAGAFAGQPCVIVSPGPSLEKNVHLLPRLAGRALIVTCTHALHALRAESVEPDLVLAMDPQDLGPHFEGIEPGHMGALLVGATCQETIFGRAERRIFGFAGNSAVDDWIYAALDEPASIAGGGSVSCSELVLALQMGCDPIVLVGQDLSFPDLRYYAGQSLDGGARIHVAADGSSFELERFRSPAGGGEPVPQMCRPKELVTVPGLDGRPLLSTQAFRNFLLWFEMVAKAKRSEVRLVNCTEGGAYIEGMEHRPLEEELADWGERTLDVESVLDRAAAIDAPERRLERMRAQVAEMLAALDDCLDKARDCARLAQQAARKPGALERLSRREQELTSALQPVLFISQIAQREIRQAEQRAREAADLSANLKASQRLYSVIERAGSTLRKPLAHALEGLR